MLVLIDNNKRAGAATQTAETPFGSVEYNQVDPQTLLLHRTANINPKSLAYAARKLGGTRVIGIIRDSGVERPSTPNNYIEFTAGRPTTFFETVGTGYVQQNPPYCPDLSQTLSAAGTVETGNLLVVEELPKPDVSAWWLAHDVSLISTETQPEGSLCRELELCYAVLALPESFTLKDILPDIHNHLPPERNCGCDQLMATARKFGKITADWFEKL